jgi:phenol 2-monooxygenase
MRRSTQPQIVRRILRREGDLATVPTTFLPRVGPLQLIDYEKVYASQPGADIFDARHIDRGGAVVIGRPDQYVDRVLAVTATVEPADFFSYVFISVCANTFQR